MATAEKLIQMNGPSYWSLEACSAAEPRPEEFTFQSKKEAMPSQRAMRSYDEDGDGGLNAPPTIPHNAT